MQLYSGSANIFIQDAKQNQIALKLKKAYFEHFGFNPSKGEEISWQNSLRAIKDVFVDCDFNDQGVALEYFLPSTSLRLDCMVTGRNHINQESAIIIELKQWQDTKKCDAENEIVTKFSDGEKEILHPSFQVNRYKDYFQDFYEVFYENNPIELKACAYLHNYEFKDNDPILDKKFEEVIKKAPIFSLNDFREIKEYLKENVSYGEGITTLDRINSSKKRPSKKLMDTVANTIKSMSEYFLLEEQQVVYDKVFECIKFGVSHHKKNVLIIEGGPGTGKSVICLNLLADLSRQNYWAEYVTGSKAFTQTLRKVADNDGLFRYTDNYANFTGDEYRDVLLVDEAHRLRKTSASMYKKTDGKSQVEEIINASSVAVFFVDNNQVVKPNEIGSLEYIESEAKRLGCFIWKEKLQAQFRCSGNEGFVNWVNNTLNIQRTANVMLDTNNIDYDFEVFDSPLTMENALREKMKEGNTARICAGFAWPWTQSATKDGQLHNDVVIGDYKRPWNASDQCKGLNRNIPKQAFWATKDGGFEQIGCIYTSQGFEFDYVGVIIGKEMMYNFDNQDWEGHPENCHDSMTLKRSSDYLKMIKNVYRVLLSRGIKGCYVYFCDRDTERFVKSRIVKQIIK